MSWVCKSRSQEKSSAEGNVSAGQKIAFWNHAIEGTDTEAAAVDIGACFSSSCATNARSCVFLVLDTHPSARP